MFQRDILLGIGLLLFSGIYWIGADAIRESPLDSGVGAQALPKALAYALAALAVILIGQAVLRRALTRDPGLSAEQAEFDRSIHLRAFGILGIGAAYLAILSFTGYLVGIALLMAATAVYMGRRASLQMAAVVVGGAVLFWLLFVHILRVPMPQGTLGTLANFI